MSYVIAAPELMTSAATDLASIGSALSEAHVAAAPPTVALVPAAADEVSAGIAHLFSRYAEHFQGLAGRAAAFHEQFAHRLTAGAHSYAATEAANAASLLPLNASAAAPAGAIDTLLGQIENLVNNLVDNAYIQLNQLFQLLEPIIGFQLANILTLALNLALTAGLIILAAPIIIPLLIISGLRDAILGY
jgi:hypothetical protein